MKADVVLRDERLDLMGETIAVASEKSVVLRRGESGPRMVVGEPPSKSPDDAMLVVGAPGDCLTMVADKVYLKAVNWPGGDAPPIGGDALAQNDDRELVINSQMFWDGVRVKGALVADKVLIDLGNEALPNPFGSLVDLRVAVGVILKLTRRVDELEKEVERLRDKE